MSRAGAAKRRSLLHKNQLAAFTKWVKAQGYLLMPRTAHTHEVLRIREYHPGGDCPDMFFYQKLRSDHITIPSEAEALVEEFIQSRRKSSGRSDPHPKKANASS